MSNQVMGTATTIGLGAGFLLAGIALLLQEIGSVSLRWSFFVPAIVVAVGFTVLLTGLLGAHRAPTRTGDRS